MDIKKLSADFAVAPQMSPADVKEAAAQGFKSIICNRPMAKHLISRMRCLFRLQQNRKVLVSNMYR